MRKTQAVTSIAVVAGAAAAYMGLSGRQTVPLSQLGSVSQVVNTTQISVHYSRPTARGRTLFGPEGVVPYGEVWSPGANDATWIEFSHDVQIAGQVLAAGRYSMWADPGQDEWTVVFSNAWNVFHIPYPGVEEDALRLEIPVGSGDYFETMTFHFPTLGPNTADLTLQWGSTKIILPIEVPMELPAP